MDYIFNVGIDDAQAIALQRIARELTFDELRQVKKCVEFGLECWEEVVETAIDEVVENSSR